jgi:hypothetical protein
MSLREFAFKVSLLSFLSGVFFIETIDLITRRDYYSLISGFMSIFFMGCNIYLVYQSTNVLWTKHQVDEIMRRKL